MTQRKPLLTNIVVLRSFAIIAVVLYHCYCPWLSSWDWYDTPARPYYSFLLEVMLVGRMPLFVFVSGYLFSHLKIDRNKYSEFLPFLWNKTKRLIIPCFFFTVLFSIVLQDNPFFNFIGYGYHMWFLKMLFWCFLSCWSISSFVKGPIKYVFLPISVAMMFLPSVNFFALGQFFKYFVFFLLGYFCYESRDRMTFLSSRKGFLLSVLLFGIVLFVALVPYILLDTLSHDDIIHSNTTVRICRELLRPLTIMVAFASVNYYISLHPDKEYSFCSWINNLSYGIYIIHDFVLQLTAKYLCPAEWTFPKNHYIITPVFFFCVIFSISVIVSLLLRKTRVGRFLIG